jgi:recombination protein RecT
MANITPVDRLKTVLNAQTVQEQFKNALKDGAGLFTTSIIDLYNTDNNLQKCSPQEVVVECLKAATLKLPINKNLGFAYVIPYDKGKKLPDGSWGKETHPQFQLGYRGYIQLAMRAGCYKFINNGIIYEGMNVEEDFLTGAVKITGRRSGEQVIGYFAYMEMVNGFNKALYWSREQVFEHAKKYSKSWIAKEKKFNEKSAWATNFDEMAQKTLIRYLLSHYGIMSVEMIGALTNDDADERKPEEAIKDEIQNNANSETIDIQANVVPDEQPAAGPDF